MERRYTLLTSFFIGGAIGGLWETLLFLVKDGAFTWRSGIMFIPLINPVYGAAALLITLFMEKRRSSAEILLFSFIAASVIEYSASFLEELILGTPSWNYSTKPFNLNGRICLLYSVFWSVMALSYSRLVNPLILEIKGREKAIRVFSLVYAFFLVISVCFRLSSCLMPSMFPAIDRLCLFFYP